MTGLFQVFSVLLASFRVSKHFAARPIPPPRKGSYQNFSTRVAFLGEGSAASILRQFQQFFDV